MAKGQSAARSHEPAPGTKWFQDKEGRVWYENSFGEWQEASPTHCDSYGDLADDQGETTPGGYEWPAWRDGKCPPDKCGEVEDLDVGSRS